MSISINEQLTMAVIRSIDSLQFLLTCSHAHASQRSLEASRRAILSIIGNAVLKFIRGISSRHRQFILACARSLVRIRARAYARVCCALRGCGVWFRHGLYGQIQGTLKHVTVLSKILKKNCRMQHRMFSVPSVVQGEDMLQRSW